VVIRLLDMERHVEVRICRNSVVATLFPSYLCAPRDSMLVHSVMVVVSDWNVVFARVQIGNIIHVLRELHRRGIHSRKTVVGGDWW